MKPFTRAVFSSDSQRHYLASYLHDTLSHVCVLAVVHWYPAAHPNRAAFDQHGKPRDMDWPVCLWFLPWQTSFRTIKKKGITLF